MTAPTIMINYQNVVQLMQHFEQQQVQIQAMHERLERQFEVLYGGAWRGGEAADRFYRELTLIMEGVTRLSRACGTAGGAVKHIAQIFNQAEEAGRDALPLALGDTGMPLSGGAASSSITDSLFGPNGALANREYRYTGKFNTIWKDLTAGNMGKTAPATRANLIDRSTTLYQDQVTLLDESLARYQLTGECGAVQLDIGNISAHHTGILKHVPGGLDGGFREEQGAYVTRLRGNCEYDTGYGALGASVDALVGVRSIEESKFVINPEKGEYLAKLAVEEFGGALVEGTAGYRSDWLSVEAQGTAAAGSGYRIGAWAGIENGVATLDGEMLGAWGVGAGAGVKITVNFGNIWDAVSGVVDDAMLAIME